MDNPLPTVTRPWLHVITTWRTVKNNGIVFKILQKEKEKILGLNERRMTE